MARELGLKRLRTASRERVEEASAVRLQAETREKKEREREGDEKRPFKGEHVSVPGSSPCLSARASLLSRSASARLSLQRRAIAKARP